MRIVCPICKNQNGIPDDDVPGSVFSILCDGCNQLLNVKVTVEAVELLKTKEKAASACGSKNRVTDYLRKHMDKMNLPVLPVLATRIRQVKNDPNGTVNDIVEVVRSDQIIASKILELANSAMYGGLVEISDLKSAIVRLGLTVTETLVTALENKRIYSSQRKEMRPFLEKFWKHALGVAVTSQVIAKEADHPKEEEVFTAGLLHDFGYVLFLQALAEADQFAVDLTTFDVKEFLDVAFQDHATIGAEYLKSKGLPERLTTIVACHEEVPEAEAANRGLHIVCLANLLCKKVGIGPTHDPDIRLEITESAQELELSEVKLAELEVSCEDLVEEISAMLGPA